MKLPNYLIIISLIHCLIITSSHSKCQQPYPCNNLILNFPFTDVRTPECGLFMVDGCNHTHADHRIQLEAEGPYYDLLEVSANNFTVRDPLLTKLLHDKSSFSFRNLSLPVSPFSSFSLASPNLKTLFTCEDDDHRCEVDSLLPPFSLLCKHRIICENDTSSKCSVIQVPINPKLDPIPDTFNMQLSAEYTLEWHVSEDCYECHRGGGQCLSDAMSKLYCKKGTSPLMLILAVSGCGLLLLLLCLLVSYIIWLRRKIIKLSYLPSKNISFATSKSDINGGSSFFGIPIFSYTELEAATNNFDPSRELGDGGFGTVYYGKLLDGREVAIKRLYEQNCRRVEQFMNEIKILTSLRHPNLVCLYGCTSRRSRELLLVYEFVSNGTVADHLHGERAEEAPLTWPIRMRIAIETATALAYLHKSDIIHRDVKTDNILLDKNFHVKVADFGLSRLFPNDATHISTVPGGTPGYIDPEYHMCYQVTDKSDVYSFGVVLVEMVSSMPAVDITRRTHEINLANFALTRIQRCAFDELIDPSLGYDLDAEVTRMTTSVTEIAFRCLQLEKEMRPSMAEVLAFLKDISN